MKQILTQFLSSTARTVVAAVALLATLALASPVPAARARTRGPTRSRPASPCCTPSSPSPSRPGTRLAELTQVMRTMRKPWTRFGSPGPTRPDRDRNRRSQILCRDHHGHAEGLKKFLPVFETLYGSMSDAQKAQADTLFAAPAPLPVGGENKMSKAPTTRARVRPRPPNRAPARANGPRAQNTEEVK